MSDKKFINKNDNNEIKCSGNAQKIYYARSRRIRKYFFPMNILIWRTMNFEMRTDKETGKLDQ